MSDDEPDPNGRNEHNRMFHFSTKDARAANDRSTMTHLTTKRRAPFATFSQCQHNLPIIHRIPNLNGNMTIQWLEPWKSLQSQVWMFTPRWRNMSSNPVKTNLESVCAHGTNTIYGMNSLTHGTKFLQENFSLVYSQMAMRPSSTTCQKWMTHGWNQQTKHILPRRVAIWVSLFGTGAMQPESRKQWFPWCGSTVIGRMNRTLNVNFIDFVFTCLFVFQSRQHIASHSTQLLHLQLGKFNISTFSYQGFSSQQLIMCNASAFAFLFLPTNTSLAAPVRRTGIGAPT